MSTTALGVMQDDSGNGVDPLTHRRIIMGHWSNPGIINGLEVTGTDTRAYYVSEGNAVLSRGDSDGYAEAYWEGGNTAAVSAGDDTNARIDAIWMRANDLQQGDSDNLVVVGVAEGTPAASPVCPSVPTGCTKIAEMIMPAGATNTLYTTENSDPEYAIPYGASLGLLGSTQDTTTRDIESNSNQYTTLCSTTFTVPTNRLVELDCSISARSLSTDMSADGDWMEYAFLMLDLQMDSSNVEDGSTCFVCFRLAQTYHMRAYVEVAAGTHTARIRCRFSNEANPGRIVYQDSASFWDEHWPGAIMRVWDKGIVR